MNDLLVILIKGPLETLNAFVDCIFEELNKKSVECYLIDLMDTDNISISDIDKVIKGKFSVVISFNNLGVFLSTGTENYWKKNDIPFYSWIVDHPRNYDDILMVPPCDLNIFVLDENHKAFIDLYYPEVKNSFVMHYGGTGTKKDKIPYSNREYDVVYLGTNGQPVEGFPLLDEFGDNGREFYESVIARMLNNTELTTEEAIRLYYTDNGINVSEEHLLYLFLHISGYIENYVRRELRFMGISELDSLGVRVDIWGGTDSWISSHYRFSENIRIHERVSPALMPEILSNTRISLCYTPWFKKGYSEKQPDSMVNGALCVSDRNGYTENNYTDGEEIIIFDLSDQSAMAQKVYYYLKHTDEAEIIAGRGMERAQETEKWSDRVEDMIDIISKDAMGSDMVSIVIPCFNCAGSLWKTWESIKSQSIGIENIECIFVDDASTDEGATWDLLQRIEAECPESVLVIHLDENMRQGGARNIGVTYASGKYLMFVDADDELVWNACEIARGSADETEADIVMFNHWRTLGGQNKKHCSVKQKAVYHISDRSDRIPFLNSTLVDYGCWNKLYRMTLVRKADAKFAEHVVYEEPLFVYPCFLYAKTVSLIPDVLYVYNLHEGSTVTSSIGIRLLDHPRVQSELLEYCMKHEDLFSEYRDIIALYFLWTFYCETLCFAGQIAGAQLPLEFFCSMQNVCRSVFPDWKDMPWISTVSDNVKKVLDSMMIKLESQDKLDEFIKEVARIL